MKKKISTLLVVVFAVSIFFNMNIGFALSGTEEISTSALIVTDEEIEKDFINNMELKLDDDEFLKTNKVGELGFKEFGKAIENKGVKSRKEIIESSGIEEAEAIFINYSLFNDNNVISYAKKQLEAGKAIYFYGQNIDLNSFASLFNLSNSIPKLGSKEKLPYQELISSSTNNKDNNLIFVGVEKEFGYKLITGEDSEYNYYRAMGGLLKDALHSKKLKIQKPYNDFKPDNQKKVSGLAKLFTTEAYAGDLSDYPVWNSQRKSHYMADGEWYLLTDLYLHRVADQDATYDDFILEVLSEFHTNYNGGTWWTPADSFYTKLQPYYSQDNVKAGGPDSQGGTTSINVNFYPPSIGFSYTPGESISVSSTFTTIGNYFEAYFNEANLSDHFPVSTIHRPQLSFANYAPSSGYTYVSIDLYQKGRQVNNSLWHEAFSPTNYYYDY